MKSTAFVVAIKLIPLGSGSSSRTTIQKEIELLKLLRHPHIMAYYGSFLLNDAIWVITEYCEGGSLSDMIEVLGEGFNSNDVKDILSCALEGLAYLHGVGVVHRDVKCANILVGGNGEIKIGKKKKIPYVFLFWTIGLLGFDHLLLFLFYLTFLFFFFFF